jgi:hypothetical protein
MRGLDPRIHLENESFKRWIAGHQGVHARLRRAMPGNDEWSGARVKPVYMDRFIDSIEWIAAIFVGVVAADVFITIFLRYFFNIQIP